ncbi:hypothetical protein [Actinoplanes palleronii]|nr:hypothetical protein [Actinoplanes palleronii]
MTAGHDRSEGRMDTQRRSAPSLPRPGAGTDLVVRDRTTGDLLQFGYRAGSFDAPVRIGTGFHLGRVPHLVAGDFTGDGARQLLCLLPDGREALLPPAASFDIGDLSTASHRPGTAVQAVVARSAGPDRVLRSAADGTVRLGTATDPGDAVATITPGAVLLGTADVTGTGPELLVRLPGGAISAIETGGARHDLGSDWDGALVVAAADLTGDALADLIAFGPAGNLLVFPHSGVFWPQFPAVTFLSPVAVAASVGAYDVIG